MTNFLTESLGDLDRRLEAHRKAGRRIILASGPWQHVQVKDIDLIDRNYRPGDVLVAAVSNRPEVSTIPPAARMRLAGALHAVEHVLTYDGNDRVLEDRIRPDLMLYWVGRYHARGPKNLSRSKAMT